MEAFGVIVPQMPVQGDVPPSHQNHLCRILNNHQRETVHNCTKAACLANSQQIYMYVCNVYSLNST